MILFRTMSALFNEFYGKICLSILRSLYYNQNLKVNCTVADTKILTRR